MYQEKVTVQMCDYHEKTYFIQKAKRQIQLFELNKKPRTSQNNEVEYLNNIKNVMAEIQEIKKMKQPEIKHFESKIFTIDR